MMIKLIAKELNVNSNQVEKTIALLDEGATVPFISRYRKEVTGSLDENQVRDIEKRIQYLRALEDRKVEVTRLIEEQGKLTDEILKKITSADKLQTIEEIYTPFKKKKKTKADIAIESGLQPLADLLKAKTATIASIEAVLPQYLNESVLTTEDAFEGAKLILAKEISENLSYRELVRSRMFMQGSLKSQIIEKNAVNDEKQVYEIYYDYEELIKYIPNHRVLALNRAEKEKIVNVKQVMSEANYKTLIDIGKRPYLASEFDATYEEIVNDALQRLILPSIEREIRNTLTDKAEESAVKNFENNLKNLLMQPPMEKKSVLGMDPGYRTGCKVVVVDKNGFYQETKTVFLMTENQLKGAEEVVADLIKKYDIDLIAIGNGTASRETESFVASLISKKDLGNVKYLIVSESGASVYSASAIANEEFPELDLTVRGSISIARRVQEPLAEFVKIPPESIGVGMYQHDINAKILSTSLSQVVESCVNMVGANVNSASWALLSYVSGIKKNVAKNIVEYRKEHGDFQSRKEILKAKGMGAKAYEQAAGFLTVPNGKNPLDSTIIHPESYHIAESLLDAVGFSSKALKTELENIKLALKDFDIAKFIQENSDFGQATVQDIYDALLKDRRDPRAEYPQPLLKDHLLSMTDLAEGMILEGTVRNVVDFGAFVDIGLKNDALLHISELSVKRVKNPLEVVTIGDIVSVKIIGLDKKKGRISLSMKAVPQEKK